MKFLGEWSARRRMVRACSVIAASVVLPGPILSRAASGHSPTANSSATDRPLLVLGDSLSAEYGLRRGEGWVALLERRLAASRRPLPVVNASISGETTAGGRTRLPALLERHRPSVLVIELGGNDALRGLDLASTEANLRAMAQAGRHTGARVLLLGMMMPPNYGKVYGERFAALYRTVAKSEGAALVPFFLEGVADQMDLFQPDRIHPNERAQARMLENAWPQIAKLCGLSA